MQRGNAYVPRPCVPPYSRWLRARWAASTSGQRCTLFVSALCAGQGEMRSLVITSLTLFCTYSRTDGRTIYYLLISLIYMLYGQYFESNCFYCSFVSGIRSSGTTILTVCIRLDSQEERARSVCVVSFLTSDTPSDEPFTSPIPRGFCLFLIPFQEVVLHLLLLYTRVSVSSATPHNTLHLHCTRTATPTCITATAQCVGALDRMLKRGALRSVLSSTVHPVR